MTFKTIYHAGLRFLIGFTVICAILPLLKSELSVYAFLAIGWAIVVYVAGDFVVGCFDAVRQGWRKACDNEL